MRLRRLRKLGVLCAALALTVTAVPTPAHAETPLEGANDFTCKPSLRHPRPVVLVHGTFENMAFDWHRLSPVLKRNGYCVFGLNYGGPNKDFPIQGTGDIAVSAQQLSVFVDRVLAATKAAKVDIVGHSQGGMMPRYYLKFLGGASKVNHLVGLVPSNHGTTLSGLVTLGNLLGITPLVVRAAPSAGQQIIGSEFLQRLNAGGDTVPGVKYTVIATRYDEVVTPYTGAFLNGPGVANIHLQERCPANTAAHLGVKYDPVVHKIVLNSLDIWGPFWPVNCTFPNP